MTTEFEGALYRIHHTDEPPHISVLKPAKTGAEPTELVFFAERVPAGQWLRVLALAGPEGLLDFLLDANIDLSVKGG